MMSHSWSGMHIYGRKWPNLIKRKSLIKYVSNVQSIRERTKVEPSKRNVDNRSYKN